MATRKNIDVTAVCVQLIAVELQIGHTFQTLFQVSVELCRLSSRAPITERSATFEPVETPCIRARQNEIHGLKMVIAGARRESPYWPIRLMPVPNSVGRHECSDSVP